MPDGRLVAIEVVRHTDGEHLALRAEINKRAWSFPGLTRGWHVTVDPTTRIGVLHAEIQQHLAVLEGAGLDRFRTTVALTSAASTEVRAAADRLRHLGVRAMISLTGLQPGELILAPGAWAGATDGDTVIKMVETLAAEKAAQLARSDADERHVFIWVEISQNAVIAALGFLDLAVPSTMLPAVELPPSIDGVWVVPALFPARVRFYARGRGWTELGEWVPRAGG